MARPLDPTPIADTRTKDTEQRRIWRDRARAYYWSTEERRKAKIEAVERFRAENPEKVREAINLARKRNRRGTQRTYRK